MLTRDTPLSCLSRSLFITGKVCLLCKYQASRLALVVRNPPANAGDVRDESSIPWSGMSPGEEGRVTHSSVLAWRIPMDRGSWWAEVYRVAKSLIRLKLLSTHSVNTHTHTQTHTHIYVWWKLPLHKTTVIHVTHPKSWISDLQRDCECFSTLENHRSHFIDLQCNLSCRCWVFSWTVEWCL